jgi:DnaJ-class molecular chaperone
MHFSSQHAKNKASGLYSDDEYVASPDRRTKPYGKESSEQWKQDPQAG